MGLLAAVLEELRRRREPRQPGLTEEQAQENTKPRKSAAVLGVSSQHLAVLRSLGPGAGRDGHGE